MSCCGISAVGKGKFPLTLLTVMLGIFPVAPEHLQHLAWSELREFSVLQGLTCLEGPGMRGK